MYHHDHTFRGQCAVASYRDSHLKNVNETEMPSNTNTYIFSFTDEINFRTFPDLLSLMQLISEHFPTIANRNVDIRIHHATDYAKYCKSTNANPLHKSLSIKLMYELMPHNSATIISTGCFSINIGI